MNDSITILVVDDHPLVREGLKSILEKHADFHVVGVARTGEQAVLMSHSLTPDIVLMDINLPDMTGIDAMELIHSRSPGIRVLLLTSYLSGIKVQDALNRGAMGFLIKNAEISELVRAIRSAIKGEHTLSPEAVKSLIQNRAKTTAPEQELTQREYEVLSYIAHGLTNEEIGVRLSISVSTVKVYAAKIYKKLDAGSRAEAVAKAINQGIVTIK